MKAVRILVLGILAGLLHAEEAGPLQSVKPGINEAFLDSNLDVSEWLKRFEVESREVFEARDAIADACGVRPGMVVADIGAGTGLYTRIFSEKVNPGGWVVAVEINPPFLKHIQARAKEEGQHNITTVLCPEDSVSLPPRSVDVAFICDTYHHFEYPQPVLASILGTLKSGGRLVVVDFIREEGRSSDWVMEHVRAGEGTVRKEIEAAGFDFVSKPEVEGLSQNYLLVFRKP
ncbi:class I SAM-dependent methyltransferase [Haloferula sargassicola]|uniref:2-methoxy-6-polyprenyl-1,4-benzoquinol methylase, mitochondrial n=1 Tax=Haloferula sargassicola TaxID=490096 RepID=A0ABP9USV0_9BACT